MISSVSGACVVTLKIMGKVDQYQTTAKRNKTQTLFMFHGLHYSSLGGASPNDQRWHLYIIQGDISMYTTLLLSR